MRSAPWTSTRVSPGQHGGEIGDLPAVRRRLDVEAHRLHHAAADDEPLRVEMERPGQGRPGQLGGRAKQRRKRRLHRDRRIRAAAERPVDVDLPRPDGDIEARLVPQVEPALRLQHQRPLHRAIGDLRLFDGEGLRRQLEVPFRPEIGPGRARLPFGRRDAGKRDGALVGGRLALAEGERPVGRKRQRIERRGHRDFRRHRVVVAEPAEPDAHAHRPAFEDEVRLDLAGAAQRPRFDERVDVVRLPALPGAAVVDDGRAFDDLEARQRDALRVDLPGAAQRPRALLRQAGNVDAEARALQHHVDDADLAFEQRRQLHLGAEALHLQLRRLPVADADVGEAQHRRGQQPHARLALDRDRPADIGGGLPLETFGIGRPVHQVRPDEGREQDRDDETPDGYEQLVQDGSPCAAHPGSFTILPGFMMFRGSMARLIQRITSSAEPDLRFQIGHLALADPVLAGAGAVHGDGAFRKPFDQLLRRPHLGRVGRIDENAQVKIAVADMADDRRQQFQPVEVRLGLHDAIGEPRDRNAGVGGEDAGARPQSLHRVVDVVARLPELLPVLLARLPAEAVAAELRRDRAELRRLLLHAGRSAVELQEKQRALRQVEPRIGVAGAYLQLVQELDARHRDAVLDGRDHRAAGRLDGREAADRG